MLRPRFCRDCGRPIGLATNIRPARCSACRISRLETPIETRPCSECGIAIPASSLARCGTCRQVSRLQHPPKPSQSQEARICQACGNTFVDRSCYIRCVDCRALRRSRIVVAPTIFTQSATPTFNPSFNSIQLSPSLAAGKRKLPPPFSASLLAENVVPHLGRKHQLLSQALRFLHTEYEGHSHASNEFPPEITAAHIRTSMINYENELVTATSRSICSSCGRLVRATDLCSLPNDDPSIQMVHDFLDNCGKQDGLWNVCSSCHAALMRGAVPRFSGKNQVNVTLCQHYPAVLDDLTFVEECLIAKSHPIGLVMKLRPGGRASSISHSALRGHFIVIPQEPGPLLQILPSPQLQLSNLIKVFWLGKQPPSFSDLTPFLSVRKDKVLAALRYLVHHNHLYSDVAINHTMIDDWSEDFIPPELYDNIISLENGDHDERVGYTVNLENGNYENDWQAAEESLINQDTAAPLMTGSITTDINGERQNPDTLTLNTLLHLVSNKFPSVNPDQEVQLNQHLGDTGQNTIPLISYKIEGQAALLNHWNDPHYFTAAFPTLFPAGIGGHLDQRLVPVSLAAYTTWALSHHSRRYDNTSQHV